MSERVASYQEIKPGSERSFGFVFATVFALIGLYPLLNAGEVRLWSIGVAVAFALVAVVLPRLLRPLNVVWFKFGMLLGRVVAPLVMILLFFLVFTPTGLVMRAFRRDLLKLRFDRSLDTYWISRDESTTSGTMKDQF